MKKTLFLLALLASHLWVNGQTNSSGTNLSPALSKAFEKPEPKEEIARLQGKKENLLIRLNELKSNPSQNAEEIARVESLIKYINHKIESLENYLYSVEYAQKTNAPAQGTMSDEEYRAKKLEWQKSQATTNEGAGQIKTTLTREEFERLPKERQERILSMPERYTIID
ncbi:MAG: hypothetical protein HYZ14_00525 [Bacteroidetes bacterium]|nr:hypothetical protein [Bacteroidota bacterium]